MKNNKQDIQTSQIQENTANIQILRFFIKKTKIYIIQKQENTATYIYIPIITNKTQNIQNTKNMRIRQHIYTDNNKTNKTKYTKYQKQVCSANV